MTKGLSLNSSPRAIDQNRYTFCLHVLRVGAVCRIAFQTYLVLRQMALEARPCDSTRVVIATKRVNRSRVPTFGRCLVAIFIVSHHTTQIQHSSVDAFGFGRVLPKRAGDAGIKPQLQKCEREGELV